MTLPLAILLIVFIIQNSKRVPIDFVFFTRQSRLIWVMLACAIIGGIVGYLVGRPGKQIRLRREPSSLTSSTPRSSDSPPRAKMTSSVRSPCTT